MRTYGLGDLVYVEIVSNLVIYMVLMFFLQRSSVESGCTLVGVYWSLNCSEVCGDESKL